VYSYALHMIKSFLHRGLKQLFEKGNSTKISPQHKAKSLRLLDALDAAIRPQDMNIPGFDFHGLNGEPKRYAVSVSGNYRITIECENEDAIHVFYEDYH
jgi:proteic killer suppression protein